MLTPASFRPQTIPAELRGLSASLLLKTFLAVQAVGSKMDDPHLQRQIDFINFRKDTPPPANRESIDPATIDWQTFIAVGVNQDYPVFAVGCERDQINTTDEPFEIWLGPPGYHGRLFWYPPLTVAQLRRAAELIRQSAVLQIMKEIQDRLRIEMADKNELLDMVTGFLCRFEDLGLRKEFFSILLAERSGEFQKFLAEGMAHALMTRGYCYLPERDQAQSPHPHETRH